MKTRVIVCGLIGFIALSCYGYAKVKSTNRSREARARVTPALKRDLEAVGLKFGAPVYFRAFKEEMKMELWVKQSGKKTFQLFRTYDVARISNGLGPKYKEGDGNTPEGFYFVRKDQLNPQSRFHLAFNIGYPNAYDRAHGRTGSALMVHGSNVSIGCYAMTDPKIEEIYTMAEAALNRGQKYFRFHAFPFRMTEARLARARRGNKAKHVEFWMNLKEGYDAFEGSKVPPNVKVKGRRYVFD